MSHPAVGWKRTALASALVAALFAGCVEESADDEGNEIPLPLPNAFDLLALSPDTLIDGGHRGGEPSIAVDPVTNDYYVSAPSGTVSTLFNTAYDPLLLESQGPHNRQSFLWKSTDRGATWTLLTVTPPPAPPVRDGDPTVGGADTDVVVDACGTVYFTDLWLGNVAISHSDDHGATWDGIQVSGHQAPLDRQWLAVGPECGTLYVAYQTLVLTDPPGQQLWVIKSTDKGMTFPQQTLVADCVQDTKPCFGGIGNMDFDEATGNVYVSMGTPDGKGAQVGVSKDEAATFEVVAAAAASRNVSNVFVVLDADAAGNVYLAWSVHQGGSYNVYLTRSTDQGATWADPIPVSGPEDEGTEMFPWIAAGDAGHVVVAWYGANDTVALDRTDLVEGDWFVYAALSLTADAPTLRDVHWHTTQFSSGPMHRGQIGTKGLYCTTGDPMEGMERCNRNLADFFEVNFDNHGCIVAAWSNDITTSEDYISLPYFGRQTGGPAFGHAPAAPSSGTVTLSPAHHDEAPATMADATCT